MEVQRPFGVVTPTVDGDVLAALAGADEEFTAPRVHAVIGDHSVEGVRKVLRRLSEQGIVTAQRHGHAVAYRLNRYHLAADAITAIAGLRNELLRRMSVVISSWNPEPIYVALFGSAATGKMHLGSDIDVFVVRPDRVDADSLGWAGQLRKLERLVSMWTGNDARILEYAQSDLMTGQPDAVVDDIRRDGVTLAGALPKRKKADGAGRSPNEALRRRNPARAARQG